MNQATKNEVAAGGKGLLRLGDKCLVVRPPNDRDFAFLAGELRRLAKAKTKSPLAALAEEFATLPPAMRDAAVQAAVALRAGGESEPSQEQINAQLFTAPGCRVWVWWLARDDQPDLQLADLDTLITEESAVEAFAELARATGVGKAFPNSGGPTSSPAG